MTEKKVDSFVLRPPGDSVDHTVEALHQYAETFLTGDALPVRAAVCR